MECQFHFSSKMFRHENSKSSLFLIQNVGSACDFFDCKFGTIKMPYLYPGSVGS